MVGGDRNELLRWSNVLDQKDAPAPGRRLPSVFLRFLKFCLDGGSGVLVDMGILYLLTDQFVLSIALSKVCAAEVAMINNFIWNELWTFKPTESGNMRQVGFFKRLFCFNAICGIGIGLAVILLQLFHRSIVGSDGTFTSQTSWLSL